MVVRFFQALHFGGIDIGLMTVWKRGQTIPGVIRVPSEERYVQKIFYILGNFTSKGRYVQKCLPKLFIQSVCWSVKRDVACELQNFETCFTRGGDRGVLPKDHNIQLFQI